MITQIRKLVLRLLLAHSIVHYHYLYGLFQAPVLTYVHCKPQWCSPLKCCSKKKGMTVGWMHLLCEMVHSISVICYTDQVTKIRNKTKQNMFCAPRL